MEKSILKALWFGHIAPWEEKRKVSEESRELFSQKEACWQKLAQILTDEQRQWLEEYDRHQGDITSLIEIDAFISGFRLGAQIMAEVMKKDQD